MGPVVNQYIVAIVSSLAGLCYGIIIGWLPPYLPLLISEETPLNTPLTIDDTSWVLSLQFIGNFIGTFIFGYLINIIGRKWSILVSILLPMISALLIVFGTAPIAVIILQLLMGIGGGASMVAVPVYVTEIAEVRIRGKLSLIFTVFLTFGITLIISIGSFVPYYTTGYILLGITVVSLILSIVILPESPTYFIQKGRNKELRNYENTQMEDANKIMLRLHGQNCDEKCATPETQTNLDVKEEATTKIKYSELYSDRITLKGIFIAISIFFFQQCTAFFSILAFSTIIFAESSNFLSANASTLILGLLKFFATFCSFFLIENMGRRILLLISSIGVTACLMIMGTYRYLKFTDVDVTAVGWIPLVVLSIYSFIFSIGLGAVPFSLTPELFSARIKPLATSLVIFIYGIIAFAVSKSFPFIASAMEWHGCFWFFGTISFIGIIFIWIFLPETKGQSTEVILNKLRGKPNVQGKI